MNTDKRSWVRWIAFGHVLIRPAPAPSLHPAENQRVPEPVPFNYVWTIEERRPGLFFCVCYDDYEREGVAVNESESAIGAKQQAQLEAGGYALHWIPVAAHCNRHHHHSGACDHLHWDKTDRVCGRPVGFSS